MTWNLASVFFSLSPRGDTTKCGKAGVENGPIILLAVSSLQSFSSMVLDLTLPIYYLTSSVMCGMMFHVLWLQPVSLA